jgi:TolB-like protein/Flp pilus assembly protein TadD
VAVLPFSNGSGNPDLDYLSDGISESLIKNLSQLPGVKVIARGSSFKYTGKQVDPQEVARELGVEAIVTGRVAQLGDNLLISTELMDIRDNTQIWSEHYNRENKQLWGQKYNRKLADVFAVQEEIAKEISEKLRLKLSGAERQQLAKRPTESLKAFQYYMLGRSYTQRGTREGVLEAIRYCEKAIEEDPNYALAYAGLADAYGNLGVRGYIAPIEGRRKAEETARQALALDETLAEAHAALGYAYIVFAPSDFSLGDRELRLAIELSPSLAVAHRHLGVSLTRQGRLDEGLEEILKARELDPLSSIIARLVAVPYYLKRDYVRAIELIRQANELGPALSVHFEIGMYLQNRLFNEALAELEKARRERKNDPILIYSTGMVYAAQGKRAEALQIVKELEEMSGANLDEAHWIAKIYAALNEKEMALSWLERGVATGAIGAFYKDEPVWDTIRSDPRFADLLRRMGVTP